MRYNLKLVYDYVIGNDIDDYDIDELEDDYIFMEQVIDYTNDKQMYNLCSDKVKDNYEFILYIINKFESDTKFIIEVAEEYLKKHETEDFDPNCEELKIIMSNIGKKKNDDSFSMFDLSIAVFYQYILMQIDISANKTNAKEKIEDFGLGFFIIQDMYASNPKIIEFFAKKFITNIFYENDDYTFEELIHNDIKKIEIIEKQGNITYLLNYISKYDSNLSAYLSAHIELLNNVKTSLDNIKLNWKNFTIEQSIRKYDMLIEVVENYYAQNSVSPTFTPNELIYNVLQDLNLQSEYDLIKKYLNLEFSGQEDLRYDLSYTDTNKMKIVNMKFFKFAMEQAKFIFSKNVISIKEYETREYKDQEKEEAKIIKFNFNKKDFVSI